jgi:uncharacterized membrane protein YGL010W
MDFNAHRQLYRRNHKTVGCKVTHMFGVPMIVASLVLVFFMWKIALAAFIGGWFLQFVGHYVFEGNKPVLFDDPGNPLTYFYAVIFVGEEWAKVLTGRSLRDDTDSK